MDSVISLAQYPALGKFRLSDGRSSQADATLVNGWKMTRDNL